jgi:hypothetical protein
MDTLPGVAHMWSWQRQKKQSAAISHWLAFFLLLLVIAAKPEDVWGSRGEAASADLWGYECPIEGCHEVKWYPEEPTRVPVCPRHASNVIMRCVQNPEMD